MELQIERMNILALLTLRQLLDYAAEHDFVVPSFKVNNLEQMQAADAGDSPVIKQGSASGRNVAGKSFLRQLFLASIKRYLHIPVVMHRDHGASPAVCVRTIQSGFSSLMMDGQCLKINKYTRGDYA
uniref:Fructose-bisphosphate aldolase class II n=1 Tax=Methylophaga nitratireducenticrescens TaxID=754476 RepID=I1XMA9_METNJ